MGFLSLLLHWHGVWNKRNLIQQINWINQLKLRVGYGVTGNCMLLILIKQQVLLLLPMLASHLEWAMFRRITIGTKASNIMPNYSLGWEKTSSLNVGVDFGVLENRISGSVEYYIAKTSDLLIESVDSGNYRLCTNLE